MPDLPRLFSDLVRVETVLWSSVDAALRTECDLTMGRYETMDVLARRGPCRVQDISDELAITWGGTSKIVDRIEAAGHCRRRANPADGRSSLIALTAVGRRRHKAATAVVQRELDEGLAALVSTRRLTDLASTLAALHRGLRGEQVSVAASSG